MESLHLRILTVIHTLSLEPITVELSYYGWSEADLDKEFALGPGILPRFQEVREKMTLREIIDACRRIYCESKLRPQSSKKKKKR